MVGLREHGAEALHLAGHSECLCTNRLSDRTIESRYYSQLLPAFRSILRLCGMGSLLSVLKPQEGPCMYTFP